jgi:hypothetical protein
MSVLVQDDVSVGGIRYAALTESQVLICGS